MAESCPNVVEEPAENGELAYKKSVGDAADLDARGIPLTAKEWDGCTLWKTGGETEGGIGDNL